MQGNVTTFPICRNCLPHVLPSAAKILYHMHQKRPNMTKDLRTYRLAPVRPIALLLASAAMFLSCSDVGVEPTSHRSLPVKGMSYTSFTNDGFARGTQANAVGDMQTQLGNDWVALCVFEYQSSPTSHDIGPNTSGVNPLSGNIWPTTSTLEDLRGGITDAHSRGLKIFLKPHLDLYSGEWRAAIQPTPAWFQAYAAMVEKYAKLADSLDVEMLCIGTEFVVATQPHFTSEWRAVIVSLRKVYGGKLTYAANWNGASDYGVSEAEFDQVQFWNDLDYVGVDAYWPLTNSLTDPLPSFETARTRLAFQTMRIASVANAFGKPVLITETGLQSVQGALAQPWNYSLGSSPTAVQDLDAQDLYYRVVIEAIGKQSWCEGIFWWNWESVPTSSAATNFTPRNKPAATSLKFWYQANSFAGN